MSLQEAKPAQTRLVSVKPLKKQNNESKNS